MFSCVFFVDNLQFFNYSVTYPAVGMSPLLPECYGTIDNPGNVTKSPELV